MNVEIFAAKFVSVKSEKLITNGSVSVVITARFIQA